jgi:hypothetical protein
VILLGIGSFGCSKEPILSVSLLSLSLFAFLLDYFFWGQVSWLTGFVNNPILLHLDKRSPLVFKRLWLRNSVEEMEKLIPTYDGNFMKEG